MGAFITIRGRVWGPLYADLAGIQWQDGGGFYRPRYQARSEVYVATTMPRRFPSGNFGLLASLLHEYRSHTMFPTPTGGDRVGGYRTLSGLIEIRILDAVLTYQYRNLLVEDYETLPGYPMPRQTQFYGVRWNFWN
jgi:outer membrane cobalamin receptor